MTEPKSNRRRTDAVPRPRVGLVVKPDNPLSRQLARTIHRHLLARKLEIVCDPEAAKIFRTKSSVGRDRIAHVVDLVVTLGGDGTFLSVARHAGEGAPVLGINAGNLGFLAEASSEDGLRLVDEALSGVAPVESRSLLDVTLIRKGTSRGPFQVLNDAVLNKGAIARMLSLHVGVDGEMLTRYRADGLIVATTTGTTAYNLSAGGPIVHPSIDAIALTPICPHTLSHRPIILPGKSTVSVTLQSKGEDVFLTLDGQEGFPLEQGDRVVVRKSLLSFRLVRNRRRAYSEILREKLRWGESAAK
jgi:NAD+ kinase